MYPDEQARGYPVQLRAVRVRRNSPLRPHQAHQVDRSIKLSYLSIGAGQIWLRLRLQL